MTANQLRYTFQLFDPGEAKQTLSKQTTVETRQKPSNKEQTKRRDMKVQSPDFTVFLDPQTSNVKQNAYLK